MDKKLDKKYEETVRILHRKGYSLQEIDELTPSTFDKERIKKIICDIVKQRIKTALREKPQLVYDKLFELGKPASPTELSKIMNTPASTICYNLNMLETTGLVKKIGGGNRVKYIVDLTWFGLEG